jgi:hypothetical protein
MYLKMIPNRLKYACKLFILIFFKFLSCEVYHDIFIINIFSNFKQNFFIFFFKRIENLWHLYQYITNIVVNQYWILFN